MASLEMEGAGCRWRHTDIPDFFANWRGMLVSKPRGVNAVTVVARLKVLAFGRKCYHLRGL